MKSKMIAVTMTQTRRLTMLHGQVGQDVGDRITLIDRVLEILENRLFPDEDARIGGTFAEGAPRGLRPEERRHGLAVDRVGLLLHLAQLARDGDDLGVLMLAKLRRRLVDLRRA